jgi:hypothetical protein
MIFLRGLIELWAISKGELRASHGSRPSLTLMLTISGLRDIVGESLTPSIASFANLQASKSTGSSIVFGYDTRPTVP